MNPLSRKTFASIFIAAVALTGSVAPQASYAEDITSDFEFNVSDDVSISLDSSANPEDYLVNEKEDGSVQIIFSIDSSSSSSRYEFPIDADYSDIKIFNDGSAIATDSKGEFVFGIASPWAHDATGQQVPTWFEISHEGIVQVVDHTSGEFNYPITADPWLGVDLYTNVYISTGGDADGQGWKINATPTTWGKANRAPHIWFAHRDELKTKAGRWNESVQEQLYCHIAGYPLSLPEYNLESWRPVVNWSISLAKYRCNPYSGAIS